MNNDANYHELLALLGVTTQEEAAARVARLWRDSNVYETLNVAFYAEMEKCLKALRETELELQQVCIGTLGYGGGYYEQLYGIRARELMDELRALLNAKRT